MGCVASRLEEEEEVVSICRERKKQLKLAIERRYALADAHYRYCKSLSGVSAAINLFVAHHSSPNASYRITFQPHSPTKEKVVSISNPPFLQQASSEPTKQTIACDSHSFSTSSVSSEEEREKQGEGGSCGYFYMDMPQPQPQPTMASPDQRDFGWDFFNPFNNVARPEIVTVYNRMSEEEVRAVREQEGIPELEDEEGERMEGEATNLEDKGGEIEAVKGVERDREKELSVVDNHKPVEGRELLEALKDIEDLFIVAYDSGKDVSRMLEYNRVHLQSNLDEIKENSTKLIQAITWRSASSSSSSYKSLVASSSSTWTEFRKDLDDDYGGMTSGSHSLTLARLYAWEKKLYDEVKSGDSIRKIYERKCNQLQNQDVRGDERLTVDKSRSAVKDLYSRILVTIRSAERISKQIEKLIEEELEPQIRELLQGMTGTWKIMLESHEIQSKIIFEVTTFSCPSYRKFCSENHRLATLQLETELRNWRSCFMEYLSAQKRYAEALFGWLSKFVAPEVEFYSRGRASALPCRLNGPPLLVLCHDWLESMNNLPEKAVSDAIRSCSRDVRALWLQQGEELLQKRKADSLSKGLDRKTSAFQKAENRMLELRLSDKGAAEVGPLAEGKGTLDGLRRQVDSEKEKHRSLMKETERMTLNGLQTCFSRVFETMTEFSRAALEMYNELVEVEKKGKKVCIEGSAEVENGSR
ncbi:protein ALTERED PHOSPHATE STARVATION RESPONSE 1-like [Salvia hispanica]|uniref:protein ALTERED PHOSPHATE STARVATION RESPONSE 1-like n=1 Tax=Salvia hispanica TaxID=49212 RepID=UPI002009CB4E|nr:protein ALTERED PHOSPHATE STARVATION RESPONSE 1-like [Salvia hispanica]